MLIMINLTTPLVHHLLSRQRPVHEQVVLRVVTCLTEK